MIEQLVTDTLSEAQIAPSIDHATVAHGGLRSLFRRCRDARVSNQVADDSSANLVEAPDQAEPNVPEIQSGFKITGESAAFWEEGDVHQPTLFSDLIKSLKNGEEQRPRVLQASSAAVLRDSIERSQLHFTEAEGILDLDDYISVVKETAEKAGNKKMMAEMTAFREKFSFLGTKEYEAATAGIAQAWLDYLKQSPEHILNIWTGFKAGKMARSQTAVALDIIKKFTALDESTTYAYQLKVDPEQWTDSPKALLIVVDDYIASGTSLRNNIKQAHNAAEANNVGELVSKTEAHIMIAKENQRQITDSRDQNLAVRSFFRAQESAGVYETNFSSAHSSMDFGFEEVFKDTAKFLDEQKVKREQPLLAYLERSYYEGFATTAAGQKALQEVVDARIKVMAAEQARQAQAAAIDRWADKYLDELSAVLLLNEMDQAQWRLEQNTIEKLYDKTRLEKLGLFKIADANLKKSKDSYRKQESESL